jgi:organic hydroperoxide reductase OsmC/OhrA
MLPTQTIEAPKPKTRHKLFTYSTGVVWTSGRSGIVSAQGKPDLSVSSPPEFKGEEGHWTPEDLFVAAVDLCTMTTFTSFAQNLRLPILEYRSEAKGTLEYVDGGYRFTAVVLRPVITVSSEDAVDAVRKTIQDAHSACLIARSVQATVTVEPRIEVHRHATEMVQNASPGQAYTSPRGEPCAAPIDPCR